MNNRPTGWLVILGDARPGNTLTARPNGISDADGMGPGSFQWTRDGVPISGATGKTYAVTRADRGHVLGVEYRYTDGAGTPELVSAEQERFGSDARMDNLAGLYRELFGRDADGPGLTWWADKLTQLYAEGRARDDALAAVIFGFVEVASKDDKRRMRALVGRHG